MKHDRLKIYIKPTCTTCRRALSILNEEGIEHDTINYYKTPFTKRELTELIKRMKITPVELLRKNESIYTELGLSKKVLSDTEIIDTMIKYPDLIQRPIVDREGRVILARPAEEINKLLTKKEK